MKRCVSQLLWLAARLFALLAACFGCSSKSQPEGPREIRWRGPETHYENTTLLPPGDQAGDDGGK